MFLLETNCKLGRERPRERTGAEVSIPPDPQRLRIIQDRERTGCPAQSKKQSALPESVYSSIIFKLLTFQHGLQSSFMYFLKTLDDKTKNKVTKYKI